ncbi:hypothetical protein MATL_G00219220 [Megalops atlanticus]|uniref:Uncharacterized protein n=1 Tax=Megalops atlanticus TaxID=7932 RepID=A0A9D3SXJ1_MEGAT|nr:hypothetical protein MATL_G00219220 [Megalops atlanticus]
MQNQWNPQHQQNVPEMQIPADHLVRGSVFIASWILTAIFIFVWASFSFVQVTMGTLYLLDCPCQPLLPVFLIVSGGVELAFHFMCRPKRPRQEVFPFQLNIWGKLLSAFHICWFLAGNVWVFSMSTPSSTPGDPKYCDRKLYLFSVCAIVLTYIFVALMLMSFCAQVCGCLSFSRAAFLPNRQQRHEQHWRGPA